MPDRSRSRFIPRPTERDRGDRDRFGRQAVATSNRGNHIAIAAPGVDILLPSPDASFQVTSGTSFAAAHISGVAALMLERKPNSSPMRCAGSDVDRKDLGPKGREHSAPDWSMIPGDYSWSSPGLSQNLRLKPTAERSLHR